MKQELDVLRKKILQKNIILNSIEVSGGLDNEKAKSVKVELDRLLFQYYKRLK